jgi:nucleoside 2-deoxyribosyltransferase
MKGPTIYLAGPDVFFVDAVEIGREKKRICAALGAIGLFPLDNELGLSSGPRHEIARAIYDSNENMMRQADCVIANLTPFRGPNVDDGTAFEIRAMIGQNKPVFGYTNVVGNLRDRVADFYGVTLEFDSAANRLPGPDGHSVEDFDLPVNLMIACGIERSGGRIFLHAADKGKVDRDLTAFTECAKAIVELFNSAPPGRQQAQTAGT